MIRAVMEMKRLLMQFINLNFIERKNNSKGKYRGIQLHQMQHARGVESHPHMLEIHAMPRMLYPVSAQKKNTLLKIVRVKLLQQLNNRAKTVTRQKYF